MCLLTSKSNLILQIVSFALQMAYWQVRGGELDVILKYVTLEEED